MRRLPESKLVWTDGCMDESIEGGSRQLYDFCTSMQPVLKAWDSDSSLCDVPPLDGSEEPNRAPISQSNLSLSGPKSRGSYAKWRQRSQSIDSKCSFQAPELPPAPNTPKAPNEIAASGNQQPLAPQQSAMNEAPRQSRRSSVSGGLVKRHWDSAPEQPFESMECNDNKLPYLEKGADTVQSNGPISRQIPSITAGVVRARRIVTPPQSQQQEVHLQRRHVVPSSSSSAHTNSPMPSPADSNAATSPLHLTRTESLDRRGAHRAPSKPRPKSVSGVAHAPADGWEVGPGHVHQYAGGVRPAGGSPMAGSNFFNPASDWLTADVSLQRATSAPSMKMDSAGVFMLAPPDHENIQRVGVSCPSAIGEYDDIASTLGAGLNLHGRKQRRRGLSSPNHQRGETSPSVKLRATSIGNLEHVVQNTAVSPSVRPMNPPTHNFNHHQQPAIHLPRQSMESAVKTGLASRHVQTPYQRSRSATWGHIDAHGRIVDLPSLHATSKAASAEQPQLLVSATDFSTMDFGGFCSPVNQSAVRNNGGLGAQLTVFNRYSSDPTISNQTGNVMRASNQRFSSLPMADEMVTVNMQVLQMDFGAGLGSMGGMQTLGQFSQPNGLSGVGMDVNAGKTLGDILNASEIHLLTGGYQTNGPEERTLLNPMRLHTEPNSAQFSPKIVLSTSPIISAPMGGIPLNGGLYTVTQPGFGSDSTNHLVLDDFSAMAIADPTSSFGNRLNQLPIASNLAPSPMAVGTPARLMSTMNMDMTPISGFLLDPTNSFQNSPESGSCQTMLSPLAEMFPVDLMSEKPTDPQELFDIYNELKAMVG